MESEEGSLLGIHSTNSLQGTSYTRKETFPPTTEKGEQAVLALRFRSRHLNLLSLFVLELPWGSFLQKLGRAKAPDRAR